MQLQVHLLRLLATSTSWGSCHRTAVPPYHTPTVATAATADTGTGIDTVSSGTTTDFYCQVLLLLVLLLLLLLLPPSPAPAPRRRRRRLRPHLLELPRLMLLLLPLLLKLLLVPTAAALAYAARTIPPASIATGTLGSYVAPAFATVRPAFASRPRSHMLNSAWPL